MAKKARKEYSRTSVLISVVLNTLARDFVGDCKSLNVYFVTDGGDTVTITYDYDIALEHWRKLAARQPLQECALEDRLAGVIASVEPESDEAGAPLVVNPPSARRK